MRKKDDLEVVVKFLKKAKVLVECWEHNDLIPLPDIEGDEYRGVSLWCGVIISLTRSRPHSARDSADGQAGPSQYLQGH